MKLNGEFGVQRKACARVSGGAHNKHKEGDDFREAIYRVTVVTSDGLQPVIIRGVGCSLLSVRGLKTEIDGANERIKQEYQEIRGRDRNYLIDALSPEELTKKKMISKRLRFILILIFIKNRS